MLGQVSREQQDEPIKPVKIGDLSMRTDYIPIDDSNYTKILKETDRPPIRRLTTTWLRTNLGLFWVNLSVIGPQSEETKSDFTLTRSQAEDVLQAISDTVKLFKEQLR